MAIAKTKENRNLLIKILEENQAHLGGTSSGVIADAILVQLSDPKPDYCHPRCIRWIGHPNDGPNNGCVILVKQKETKFGDAPHKHDHSGLCTDCYEYGYQRGSEVYTL